MKYLLTCLLVTVVVAAAAQPVKTGSFNGTKVNTEKDMVIEEGAPAPLVTVQSSALYTKGKLTFSNATVVLDEATVQCDELEFTAAVRNVQCKGKVRIDCRKILLTGAPSIVWSATGEATLNLTVKASLPAVPAMNFQWSNDFTISLARR